MRELTPFELRTFELLLLRQENILVARMKLCLDELAVEGREVKPRDRVAWAALDAEELEVLGEREELLKALLRG